MLSNLYLPTTMLRRILACLALITGLAAVGSPAEARMMPVLTQSVVEGAQAQPANQPTVCDAPQRRANLRSKVTIPTNCRPRKSVTIVIPTIQLGPDRALE